MVVLTIKYGISNADIYLEEEHIGVIFWAWPNPNKMKFSVGNVVWQLDVTDDYKIADAAKVILNTYCQLNKIQYPKKEIEVHLIYV